MLSQQTARVRVTFRSPTRDPNSWWSRSGRGNDGLHFTLRGAHSRFLVGRRRDGMSVFALLFYSY